MTEVTIRPSRRPRKPNGRKTANRFAKLAGGDSTPESALPGAETGLIGAMTAAADAPMRVDHIPVVEVEPHPFNDPQRSLPRPGDSKWEELVAGVRANGVQLPVLAVPRDAFLAARPSVELPPTARYVLVYGHRRRAAAIEAGRPTIPAIVDASIMADNGDLDAMVAENLGRQDLPELAEADLFARYSDLGLSQRAIASRLGIDQATVSRRLALLLLTEEVRKAVETGTIPTADAAALAGALPYGPPRRWQKTKDPQQNTDQRRVEQTHALALVLERDMTATRAAERVVAERQARAQAEQWGVVVVDDPRAELGEDFYAHRVASYDGDPGTIAAIDPALGTLVLYSTSAPNDDCDLTAGDKSAEPATKNPRKSSRAAAKTARAHRRQACAIAANQRVSSNVLLNALIEQYLCGTAARTAEPAVAELLADWGAPAGSGNKARAVQAWQRAVAAGELHISGLEGAPWDAGAVAHMRLLVDRGGYQPTQWERDQLEAAG